MVKNFIKFLVENAMSNNGTLLTVNVKRLEHVIAQHPVFNDEGVRKAWDAAVQKETDRLLAAKQKEEEQKRIAADEKVQSAAADLAAKKAIAFAAASDLEAAEKKVEDEARRSAQQG